MTMTWIMLQPGASIDMLGFIPSFLNDEDPRDPVDQIDIHYQHGGGWSEFVGHRLSPVDLQLSYPGDPPLSPTAMTAIRNFIIVVYPYSWVVIIDNDLPESERYKNFRCARID